MAGGGGGHLQFLEQDVEAVDDQLAGLRLVAKQTGGRGTHLLQGDVGGGQGAGLLEHIPQTARVDGEDARVAGHHRVAHIAQEPGHVPEGLAHPIRAIDPHGDGVEAAGQHNAHIGVGLNSLKHAAQQALAAGTLHEGLDRGAECLLVGGKGNGFLLGSGQGSVEIGEGGTADEDPVGGAGHDGAGVGGDAPSGLNAGLAALEKGDQRVEFAPIRKAILLFSPSNAGERQGVVELGSDPGAAAAGGHGHERERAWLGHVTAGPSLSGTHEQMFAADFPRLGPPPMPRSPHCCSIHLMQPPSDAATPLVSAFYDRFPYPGDPLQDGPPPGYNWRWCVDSVRAFVAGRLDGAPRTWRILDAGCGTGVSTDYLCHLNPGSSVLAVDISPGALAVARERLQRSGAGERAGELRVEERSLLDLGDESHFDHINSVGVLHHLDQPEAGLRALAARLAPGGSCTCFSTPTGAAGRSSGASGPWS